MTSTDHPQGFEALAGEECIAITTFRADGSQASTPVWFVSDDLRRRLFVETGRDTRKVGRIAQNPHVRVAPCTSRGVVTGPPLDASARLVDEGKAYPCFCTPERLDALRAAQAARKQPPGYDGLCRALDHKEAAARASMLVISWSSM